MKDEEIIRIYKNGKWKYYIHNYLKVLIFYFYIGISSYQDITGLHSNLDISISTISFSLFIIILYFGKNYLVILSFILSLSFWVYYSIIYGLPSVLAVFNNIVMYFLLVVLILLITIFNPGKWENIIDEYKKINRTVNNNPIKEE